MVGFQSAPGGSNVRPDNLHVVNKPRFGSENFSCTRDSPRVQQSRYQLNTMVAMGATQDGKIYKYQLVTQGDRQ
jgi:hypothetical protein